jgi:hypothetical protein
VLRHVKVLGVRVALDGFGTGYSSLSYIRRFALDVLTVDSTFIEGLSENAEDRAIVEHVVGMSRSLGIQTLAMGVETPEQLAELHRVGCDLGQGFLFSTAVLAEEISTFIASGIPDARPAGVVQAEAAAESFAVAAAASVDAPSVVTPVPRRALAAVSATAGRIAARNINGRGDDVVIDRRVAGQDPGADPEVDAERHAAVLESILPSPAAPGPANASSSTPPGPPRPVAPGPRPADASESAAAVLLPKLREFRPPSADKP